jgi:hypothetical protein
MQNNNPKSEMPAMKEKAAKAKDLQGLQKSLQKERAKPGNSGAGRAPKFKRRENV